VRPDFLYTAVAYFLAAVTELQRMVISLPCLAIGFFKLTLEDLRAMYVLGTLQVLEGIFLFRYSKYIIWYN